VSRPHSAFNRLGSFIGWEQKYEEDEEAYKVMAENIEVMEEDSRSV
jgi:hypothetical protein